MTDRTRGDEIAPNGLTYKQIDARPKPYVGMIVCFLNSWYRVNAVERTTHLLWLETVTGHPAWCVSEEDVLLPGEPGLEHTWPPPKEFQHEWKEGDRAWVLLEVVGEHGPFMQWIDAEVELGDGDELRFGWRTDDDDDRDYWSIDTPALYIPPEDNK